MWRGCLVETDGKLILIIDDDDAARRMVRRYLTRRGFSITEADNGRDGVTAARDHRPDIVLLDLRMPGELSGFDVAKEMREDEQLQSIPILVVSASAHFDAKERTRLAGCRAFIEKPVDFDELMHHIAKNLVAPG
jgi:two-component system cell cycle response regulator DivK